MVLVISVPKNLCKLIIKNVVTCFFGSQCISMSGISRRRTIEELDHENAVVDGGSLFM